MRAYDARAGTGPATAVGEGCLRACEGRLIRAAGDAVEGLPRFHEIAATLCEMEARLDVLIAILQGIGKRSIINPKLDKSAIVSLVQDIIGALLRPQNGNKP